MTVSAAIEVVHAGSEVQISAAGSGSCGYC